MTSTFWRGNAAFAVDRAYTAPSPPMVTTMQGMLALCTLAGQRAAHSSGPCGRTRRRRAARPPAGCRRSSRSSCKRRGVPWRCSCWRCGGVHLCCTFGAAQNLLDGVLFRSSSNAMPSQSAKNCRLFLQQPGQRGGVRRLEMAAQTSPSLSNTDSQVPMPSGTFVGVFGVHLMFGQLVDNVRPEPVSSTRLTKVGRSSIGKYPRPHCGGRRLTCSTRPALRPPDVGDSG